MPSPLNSHIDAALTGEVDGIEIPLVLSNTADEVAQIRDGAGVASLGHVQTVRLSGPDARRFTNGMFTNNIRDLKPGECVRSAMCDDRGRVQGLIDVLCTADDTFEGVLEGVNAEWFESRYGLYIVFDDVEMDVFEDDPWVLSLQGPKTAAILEAAGLPQPVPGHHLETDNGVRVANKDRTGLGGVDLIAGGATIVALYDALLAAGAAPIGYLALEQLRIESGRARWPIDGTEKSMVHELGINEEVCSFNKGCYLGQEVINRVDVKGQINKKLHTILVDADPTVLPGAAVQLGDDQVGTITSAAQAGEKAVALAVIRKTAWTDGQIVQITLDSGPVEGTVQHPA